MKIKKVINISDRVLTIDNIKLEPKEDHIWKEDSFTERLITRLRILENLKFVRVFDYDEEDIGYYSYMPQESESKINLVQDTTTSQNNINTSTETQSIEDITEEESKSTKKSTKKTNKGDK
jgi:hypothetical protein